ncbi:phosphotransferase [Spiroplasma endosymbiont of Glossina fuscipes fuscipes]|uniref:phosphotransferase n=1 Tax=Spiroplasma endosymbiont of Glossina fuscipes fuscipes TaxID=2004463 RepID=UPI003C77C14F
MMKYKIKTKLNLGITNQNYQTVDNLFIRYSNPFTNLFIDHQNEMLVLEKIKNSKLTLPIIDYGYDNDHFFLVTPYYSTLQPISAVKLTKEVLKSIATIIKQLWEIKITPNDQIKIFQPQQFLETFKNAIKKPLVDLQRYEANLDYIKLQTDDLVLCHNDLNGGNLVFVEQNLYLIDFEYAMQNDKFFDIASFASETLTTKAKQTYWFSLFKLTPTQQQKVNAWMYYQNIVWIAWANYMYEQTNNDIFLAIIDLKLLNLQNNN